MTPEWACEKIQQLPFFQALVQRGFVSKEHYTVFIPWLYDQSRMELEALPPLPKETLPYDFDTLTDFAARQSRDPNWILFYNLGDSWSTTEKTFWGLDKLPTLKAAFQGYGFFLEAKFLFVISGDDYERSRFTLANFFYKNREALIACTQTNPRYLNEGEVYAILSLVEELFHIPQGKLVISQATFRKPIEEAYAKARSLVLKIYEIEKAAFLNASVHGKISRPEATKHIADSQDRWNAGPRYFLTEYRGKFYPDPVPEPTVDLLRLNASFFQKK